MKVKLKRLQAIFLTLAILITNFVGVFSENIVLAQTGKPMEVTDLRVEPASLRYGEKFSVSGNFGGPGYTANPGDILNVSFNTKGTNVMIPNIEKDLYDNGVKIGVARFSSSGIQIEFTEGVKDLHDVSGNFTIDGQAYNTDTSSTNTGTVEVKSGDISRNIEVKYEHNDSGTVTENVYSKQGVSYAGDPDNVRWIFTLNAAQKDGTYITYNISDTLNEDMDWNEEAIKSDPYFIRVTNKSGNQEYISYKDAASRGIMVNFNDKTVTIKAYGSILNQNQVEITLLASLTDEVKEDVDKKFVENTSEVSIDGDPDNEWEIKEEDKSASADVYHVDAQEQGVKTSKVKFLKKSYKDGHPIPNVKFEVRRKDDGEFEFSKKFKESDYLKLSEDKKVITAITDDKGEFELIGLKEGEYKYKEIEAPEFIDFNLKNSEIREFEISPEKNKVEQRIQNNVKKIQIPVKKIWKGGLPEGQEKITLVLKQDNGIIADKLIMDGIKDLEDSAEEAHETKEWEGHFKEVPTHEYVDGEWKEIIYTVEEEGTKYGTVTIGEDTYRVDVKEPEEGKDDRWTVTNTRVSKVTADKIWAKNGIRTEKNEKPREDSPDVYFKLQEKFGDRWIDSEPRQVIKYEGERVEFDHIEAHKDYRVVETKDKDGKELWSFDGYQTSVEKKEARSIEWNFTNNYETRDVRVDKVWKGGPSVKPEVYFQLMDENGIVEIPGQENPILLAENKTYVEWTDLPKRDLTGKEIKYMVKEVTKDGKDWSDENWISELTAGRGSNSGPYVFTNKNIETVEVFAKKIWIGGNDKAYTAPTFKLIRYTSEDTKSELVEDINPEIWQKENSNEFNYKWTGLEKYDEEGREYIYNVFEDKVKDGKYTVVNEDGKKVDYLVSGPVGDGSKENPFTITNSYSPGKTSINAMKVWQGGEGEERPNIKLQLYKDGQPEGEARELVWPEVFVSWTDLEETRADGSYYEYTVDEVEVPKNYKKNEKIDGRGSSEDPFVITNTFESISVKLTKNWENVKKDEKTPSAYFQLVANNENIGPKKKLIDKENIVVWEDLPKYDKEGNEIDYKVKEVNQDGGDWEFDGYIRGPVLGNKTDGFTITNTKEEEPKIPETPKKPEKRNIKVVKKWDLADGEIPVEKIEVELYKDGLATGKTIELNEENRWTGEFNNLDKYDLSTSKEHTYSIKEIGESENRVELEGRDFRVTYEGNMDFGFIIMNKEESPDQPVEPEIPETPKKPEKRNIKVVKKWDLPEGEYPAAKIEVELYKNGIATGKIIELNEENNWTGEFNDLKLQPLFGKEYEYTVKELGEDNNLVKINDVWYRVTYIGDMEEGFLIKNEKEVIVLGNSVKNPNKPNRPNKPNKPSLENPTYQEPSKGAPQTGDSFAGGLLYIGSLILASIGFILIRFRKIKNKN